MKHIKDATDINITLLEIRVLFFGVLADVTGTSFKTYLEVTSFNDMMMRIRDDYPPISNYKFRICHNRNFIENDPSLNDGDEIAFLPPFYGG